MNCERVRFSIILDELTENESLKITDLGHNKETNNIWVAVEQWDGDNDFKVVLFVSEVRGEAYKVRYMTTDNTGKETIYESYDDWNAYREKNCCDSCHISLDRSSIHTYTYIDKSYCGECQSTLRESHKLFECCECQTVINGHTVVHMDGDDYCEDCAPEDDKEANRNLTIYVLNDGESWGETGENRKATENDVERWGEYNIKLDDWIGVVNDSEFISGKSVSKLLISQEEFDDLNSGGKPRFLDDYYDRLIELDEEEELTELEKEIFKPDDDFEQWRKSLTPQQERAILMDGYRKYLKTIE